MSYHPHQLIFLIVTLFVIFGNCAPTFTDYYFANVTIGASKKEDTSNDIALDSMGNTFVVGATWGDMYATMAYSPYANTDIFVAKFDPKMHFVWGKQFGTNETDEAFGVCLSADETKLYVCGTYYNTTWLAVLDASNGSMLQNYSLNEPPNVWVSQFSDVAICGDYLCVTGYYYTNTTYHHDSVVIKLNTDLTVVWTHYISNLFHDEMGIVEYSQGRLFAAGSIEVYGVGKEFYLLELDINNGSKLFDHHWPNSTCDFASNWIVDIAVASDGIYYIGSSEQEFINVTTTSDVCDQSYWSFVIGKLDLNDLTSHLWFYNISQISSFYSVDGHAMDLGDDNLLYIVGASDAETLLGQPNSGADIAKTVAVNTTKGRLSLTYTSGGSSLTTNITVSTLSQPPSSTHQSNNTLAIVLGVVLGAFFMGVLLTVAFLLVSRKKKQQKRALEMSERPANVGLTRQDSIGHKRWNIEKSEIEMGQQIGQGAFGVVFKARWRNCDCVVKQLNPENYTDQQVQEFLKEANTMQTLRNHKNVCTVFGICLDPISIVLEYVSGGSLKDLVYQPDFQLTNEMLISFAKDIAGGMSHLHRENLLHCDLACRNLLIEKGDKNQYVVKVADFGLTRNSENSIYVASANSKFPIRWSAPELLTRREVSRACDIWSYGVVLWEIIEGKFPYYQIDMNEAVVAYVCEKKQTLPTPTRFKVLVEILGIMTQCWSFDPSSRPSFDAIFRKLEELEPGQAEHVPSAIPQGAEVYGNNFSPSANVRDPTQYEVYPVGQKYQNTYQNATLYGNESNEN